FETAYDYCRNHACRHCGQDAEEKLLHSRHLLIIDSEDCPPNGLSYVRFAVKSACTRTPVTIGRNVRI
ncbi:MAG: hypothetical protein LBC14_00090, partial [Desulfovibrio sp.]|nr:hypothetical protein [Desulfovibrio sp.]